MQRLDPQDAGPGYRNVIGLPGGVDSPLFKVLQVQTATPLLPSKLVYKSNSQEVCAVVFSSCQSAITSWQ